jgi:predicted nicotinamide N-methyase
VNIALDDGRLPLVERAVTLGAHTIYVFEPRDLDGLLDARATANALAPYGVVTWPSAHAIAARLLVEDLRATTVVDVGAGAGLVSVAAALSGARVLAVDVDPVSEDLVRAAARRAQVDVTWNRFYVIGNEPLAPGALVVVADLLYEPVLAGAAARRVTEAVRRGSRVIVGDPARAGRAAFASLVRDAGIEPHFVDVDIALTDGCATVGVWDSAA